MNDWEDVLAAALVGTGRRPPPPPAPDVVDRGQSDEATLLAEAAALAVWRSAGWIPPLASSTPAAAPADDRPECSPAAAQVLGLLLGDDIRIPGGAAPLIDEWLSRAADAGRRVPRRLLPAVLDSAARTPLLRPAAVRATGPLGRWLAVANPAWAPVLSGAAGIGEDAEPAETFATGTRAERLAALAAVRRADPGAGRDLLATTWSTDSAADRAAFLALLADGLSDDDEPFLEAALDDRARSVRTEAVALLNRLPGSRRAARMADRLRPLVSTGGRIRRSVEVAFPAEPDPAARRDGVTDDAPPGLGPRAWWLVQYVAGAPLAFWNDTIGRAPADIVKAATTAELELGWEWAAADQRDGEWAAVLFARRPTPRLVPALGAGAAAAVEAVARAGRVPPPALIALLNALDGPWPVSLSTTVVQRLSAAGSGHLFAAAPLLAGRMNPSALAALEAAVARMSPDDRARREVAGAMHALTLRRTIAEELV